MLDVEKVFIGEIRAIVLPRSGQETILYRILDSPIEPDMAIK